MRDDSGTKLHIEAGGEYPDLQVMLEPILRGDDLDSAVAALNELTRYLSTLTFGSGDPGVYSALENRTETTFAQLSALPPRDEESNLLKTLVTLASKRHSFAYNPFLLSRAHSARARRALDVLEGQTKTVANERKQYAIELKQLTTIASKLGGLNIDGMHQGIEGFRELGNSSFSDSAFYGVALLCVHSIESLLSVPKAGEGESWQERAIPFWRLLAYYAPTSRCKIIATGIFSRLTRLDVSATLG